MRRPADETDPGSDAPPMTIAAALVIPLLGLGMLHGIMSVFDALLV